MHYDGDEWTDLFPILKGFAESDFTKLIIDEQQCVTDPKLFKYTLYYEKLPIDTKMWRDNNSRRPDGDEAAPSPAKVAKVGGGCINSEEL